MAARLKFPLEHSLSSYEKINCDFDWIKLDLIDIIKHPYFNMSKLL